MKTCNRCMITKDFSDYYRHATGKNGLVAICKECHKEKQIIYLSKNKEERAEYNREYYKKNKDYIIKKSKEYRKANKENEREFRREYIDNKLKTDQTFNRAHRLRTLLRIHLKKRGLKKKSTTKDVIGCSFEELNSHLVNTAILNYGSYDANENYHIDHIIPLSTANSVEEVELLFNFKNLQLLKPKDNLKKSNKLNYNLDFENNIPHKP